MRGSFVIEGISTTRTEFFSDGAARKIEFSIKLKRVDDNDSTLGNTLLGRTAGNLLYRLGWANSWVASAASWGSSDGGA